MMKRVHKQVVAAALAAAVLGVSAVEAQMNSGSPREGEAYWQSITAVNLNSEARRMVMPDRVSASLNADERGTTAVSVQNKVNQKAQAVKAAAARVPGVKFTTSQYNVYRINDGWIYDANGKRERKGTEEWQATQTFNIDSADAEAIQKLAGELQAQGLTMQGFNFYLSREANDKIKEELVGEAVASLKAQAERVAGFLGERTIRIARLDVNSSGGGGYPRPMMAYAAKAEGAARDMAAPVAAPDELEVNVSVSAEVHLK